MRRLVTIPGITLALVAAVALAPLCLPLLVLRDLAARTRLSGVRAFLFLLWLLCAEQAGLLAAGVVWLLHGGRRGPAFEKSNTQVQRRWNGALFGGAVRLFGLRVEWHGCEALAPGPLVYLSRHASIGDTLLPIVAGGPQGLTFRFVLKRGLLWDPCLDVVGQRLPNAFVSRGRDPQGDLAALRSIARGLGATSGVVIFPEGTRASPARRAALLAALERKGDAAALARARALHTVLPIRLGGALALLEAAPEADLVFCAHSGFDGIRSLKDFASGAFVGAHIRVHFFRVPRAEVPAGSEARAAWLHEQWLRVDALSRSSSSPTRPSA